MKVADNYYEEEGEEEEGDGANLFNYHEYITVYDLDDDQQDEQDDGNKGKKDSDQNPTPDPIKTGNTQEGKLTLTDTFAELSSWNWKT